METRARGWWHAYGDVIPEGFDVYIGLEEAASDISWYESELVPGLFQTEDYARAVIKTHLPDLTAAEEERRVQLRMARRTLVTRVTAAPRIRAVVGESTLRRPVGGPRVMRAQLERLAESAELPNVSVRVVPFSAGMHQGVVTGQFQILRFLLSGDGRDSEPPTVHVDGFTGELYLDKPTEVERYESAFTAIVGTSLDEAASKELIRRAAEEMGG